MTGRISILIGRLVVIDLPINYDYLFKLKDHYASSNVSTESKDDIVVNYKTQCKQK